jgi:hypothetical protein
MAIRSQNLEIITQVPVNGGRLGGRLYDQQFDG